MILETLKNQKYQKRNSFVGEQKIFYASPFSTAVSHNKIETKYCCCFYDCPACIKTRWRGWNWPNYTPGKGVNSNWFTNKGETICSIKSTKSRRILMRRKTNFNFLPISSRQQLNKTFCKTLLDNWLYRQ